MYQRKHVLLLLTTIVVFCTIPVCFAEKTGNDKPINEDRGLRETKAPLPDTEAQAQHLPDSAETLNLRQQLEQGLDELRQSLRKQQESISLQERQLNDQSRTIAVQKRRLEKQDQELQNLRDQLLSQDQLDSQRAAGIPESETADHQTPSIKAGQTSEKTQSVDEKLQQLAGNEKQPEKTAGSSEDNKKQTDVRPEIVAIPDIGGVLTPRGKLMLEPAIQASHSSLNQFTFLGVEIIDAFLVGLIQAEDTDRDLVSATLTGRYGITSRLEAELKIPYVYRSDQVSGTIPQAQDADNVATTVDRDFSGHGLGDIELAFHYQINDGLDGWPYFIGNLRWKSDTGQGPFDVDRDEFGKEDESPTGSGFHSLEPSLTILYPNDPTVFFANIGYLINLEEKLDKTFIQTIESSGDVETQTFGNVDPGNSVRISFGMGYSLNERSSFTLGYKHDFIKGTEFEINDSETSTNDLDVGSLLLGWGFSVTPDVNVNLNLELGITQDAPDVMMTLRVPFAAYKP